MILIYKKAKKRIWSEIVSRLRDTSYYTYIYKSYWHYLLFPNHKQREVDPIYFTARPNPGAGIGHQLANWIAGYWFAKQFGLRFAHSPFSSTKWETILGFGNGEPQVNDLLNDGYKLLRLPLFDENNQTEIDLVKAIISSYSGKKVIFRCEQDQFYKNQFGVIEDIQRKFYSAPSRKEDKITFSPEEFNIAVHIRRGDIVIGQQNKNPNLTLRWQNLDYFTNVLNNFLNAVVTNKPIAIHVFSQGETPDFDEFKRFGNVKLCLEMSAADSFIHMVYADALITSKSSFSYKPALINKGIKICPKDFWHGYPSSKDWILAGENGNLITNSSH